MSTGQFYPRGEKNSKKGFQLTNKMVCTLRSPGSNQRLKPIDICPKFQRQQKQKGQAIKRHCSEDDFKNYFKEITDEKEWKRARAQGEYISGDCSSSVAKVNKHIFTTSQYKGPGSPKQGKTYFPGFLKPNELKQTTSTQSAENKKNSLIPIPTFLRNKAPRSSHLSEKSEVTAGTANPFLKRENFRILSKLGEGKFGKVFLVKENRTGLILAMKIVQKKRIISEGLLDQFIRQLKIQTFLCHPNIISLYGFFHDSTHFYNVLELGCDGQLYSLISNGKTFTEESTSFIAKSLLSATDYMHKRKILHRDLKPENIVLIMGNVKICDFGWAVNKISPGDLRNTYCGTPLYLSPEILQGNSYDEKVDLWAIGIIAYEILCGSSPFSIIDQYDLQKIIHEQIQFPQKVESSEEFQEFVKAILTKDPKKRLNSSKLLQLQFITRYSQLQTCEELCR